MTLHPTLPESDEAMIRCTVRAVKVSATQRWLVELHAEPEDNSFTVQMTPDEAEILSRGLFEVQLDRRTSTTVEALRTMIEDDALADLSVHCVVMDDSRCAAVYSDLNDSLLVLSTDVLPELVSNLCKAARDARDAQGRLWHH